MQGKSQPYKMGGWRRIILQKITHTSFFHSNLPSLTTSPSKKWRSLLVSSHWWLLPPPCWPKCKRLHHLNQANEKTLTVISFWTHSASPDVVDDVLARDEHSFSHSLREIEDMHARNADEVRALSIPLLCDFIIGTHSLNFTSHLDTLRQTRYRKAREVRSDFLYLTRFNEI